MGAPGDLCTRSLWDDAEAASFDGDLGLRVYTSRLLGRDPALVLHGGGNTSVKGTVRTVLGEDVDVLHVKGSGWDLRTIEAAGFAPVRLDALHALARLEQLSDVEMARQLRVATLDPAAPAPSVEAILHAVLPHRFVDHTHPDLLLSVMNTPDGDDRVRAIYGDDVIVVPYVMPGFPLSRLCAELYPKLAHEGTIGMVLMHHGLFSFGETARESYERMIELVRRAEAHLADHGALRDPATPAPDDPGPIGTALAQLRLDVSKAAGRPLVATRSRDARATRYAARSDVSMLSQSGPATPDHVIRTKRLPLLGREVAAYVDAYRAYVEEHAPLVPGGVTPLDPAPRVALDTELGLVALGGSATEARVVADIAEHTVGIVEAAAALGGWRALPAAEIFDVEYWDLEQAKLRGGGSPAAFAGEVALVTGAASGIGRACVLAFLTRGAAVIGLDLSEDVTAVSGAAAYRGVVCDVTDEAAVRDALEDTARTFGGLDMLVLNAGIFPPGRPIASLDLTDWDRTLRVNLDANLTLMREAHALLRLAPRGGRVVVNASKNVPAPGPGAAAYSASKAALTQLARVAALEWGADGIRVNVVHPNAVFDTGVWSDEVLAQRAGSYGLTVDEYRRNNLLGAEVTSTDVAEVVATLCDRPFSRTTGAQIPVDGGNDRVI